MQANLSRRAAGNRVAPFTKSYTAPTPLRNNTRAPLHRVQVLHNNINALVQCLGYVGMMHLVPVYTMLPLVSWYRKAQQQADSGVLLAFIGSCRAQPAAEARACAEGEGSR